MEERKLTLLEQCGPESYSSFLLILKPLANLCDGFCLKVSCAFERFPIQFSVEFSLLRSVEDGGRVGGSEVKGRKRYFLSSFDRCP